MLLYLSLEKCNFCIIIDLRHAKYLEIFVWFLCSELDSVLHKFYEELVNIYVQKIYIPLYTHNKQAKKDWTDDEDCALLRLDAL